MREVLNKDKESERPKYAPADNKNAEGKMFENIEDASSFWIHLWNSQGTGKRNAQWLEDIRSASYSRVPSPSENTWKLDTMEATKVLARAQLGLLIFGRKRQKCFMRAWLCRFRPLRTPT